MKKLSRAITTKIRESKTIEDGYEVKVVDIVSDIRMGINTRLDSYSSFQAHVDMIVADHTHALLNEVYGEYIDQLRDVIVDLWKNESRDVITQKLDRVINGMLERDYETS